MTLSLYSVLCAPRLLGDTALPLYESAAERESRPMLAGFPVTQGPLNRKGDSLNDD